MPGAGSNVATSKMPGAPLVVARFGRVRVVQRKLQGWVILAFGLGLPGIVLVSEYVKRARFRADPLAYILGYFRQLELLPWWGWPAFMIGSLFLAGLLVYGLIWLLWRRVLEIDLGLGRVRFTTGIWPRVRTIEVKRSELTRIELRRTVMAGDRLPGPPHLHERWEVSLVIPGSTEPLHLGMWGLRRDALAEIERFRSWLPDLAMVESDSNPEVARAVENRDSP